MPKRKSRSPVKRRLRSRSRKARSKLAFGSVSSKRRPSRSSELRSKLIAFKRAPIAQFRIFDEYLADFKRLVDKPMDCVINAMQLIGMFDFKTAELLRIKVGTVGFQKSEIEKIFTLYLPHIFKFESYNYDKWANEIKENLKPSNVMFVGYAGHVFLIGKKVNGEIIMIDPQLPKEHQVCNLSDSTCFNFIANKATYFILKSSFSKVSERERLAIIRK
jgi:hypothetical protein